jgi:uridine kinase
MMDEYDKDWSSSAFVHEELRAKQQSVFVTAKAVTRFKNRGQSRQENPQTSEASMEPQDTQSLEAFLGPEATSRELYAAPKEKLVIGISGFSRSGKGWVSKGLIHAVEAVGRKAVILGQEDFWFQTCRVKVNGRIRTSDEVADCIDHEKFAAAIKEKIATHDVVIVEGFQLAQDSRIVSLLNHIFLLQLDKDEACRRRTQPRDAMHNPSPISKDDFDDILWPEHKRYLQEKVVPLGERVVWLPSPVDPTDRDELVHRIMRNAEIMK